MDLQPEGGHVEMSTLLDQLNEFFQARCDERQDPEGQDPVEAIDATAEHFHLDLVYDWDVIRTYVTPDGRLLCAWIESGIPYGNGFCVNILWPEETLEDYELSEANALVGSLIADGHNAQEAIRIAARRLGFTLMYRRNGYRLYEVGASVLVVARPDGDEWAQQQGEWFTTDLSEPFET